MSPRTRLRRALLRFPRLFLQLCEPDDGELGLLGEAIAADHLARHGWRILRRRLRTRQPGSLGSAGVGLSIVAPGLSGSHSSTVSAGRS